MRINLPNKITIGRLFLAIVFFVLLSLHDQKSPSTTLLDVSLALFIVAAASDALDGHLARKNNQVTAFGRVLDPLVDKILICGVYTFFSSSVFVDAEGVNVTGVQAWMVVLILGRELLVTGLRGYSEGRGRAYAAVFSGKIKMIVQSVTAAVVICVVAHADPGSPDSAAWVIMHAMVWLTIGVTLLSVVQYLIRSKDILAEAG